MYKFSEFLIIFISLHIQLEVNQRDALHSRLTQGVSEQQMADLSYSKIRLQIRGFVLLQKLITIKTFTEFLEQLIIEFMSLYVSTSTKF